MHIINSGGDFLLNFILGSMFGGTVGVLAMCLCTAAKYADEHLGDF